MKNNHTFHGKSGSAVEGYDSGAILPAVYPWDRQSPFLIPKEVKCLWKIHEDYASFTALKVGVVIDSEGCLILADTAGQIEPNHEGRILKLRPDGSKEVLFSCARHLYSHPVIHANHAILVVTRDSVSAVTGKPDAGSTLFCVAPDGMLKWTFDAAESFQVPPSVGQNGNIYCYSFVSQQDVPQGKLFCLSPEGALLWTHDFQSATWTAPVFTKSGLLLLGLNHKKSLVALDQNGEIKWELSLGSASAKKPPSIGPDGTIYCLSGRKLFAISPDGEIKWEVQSGPFYDPPAIRKDGVLFLPCLGKMLALDQEGQVLGEIAFSGAIPVSAPIIDANGNLLQGSCNPKTQSWVEVFSPSGEKLWKYVTRSKDLLSVTLSDHGRIYALYEKELTGAKYLPSYQASQWHLHALQG